MIALLLEPRLPFLQFITPQHLYFFWCTFKNKSNHTDSTSYPIAPYTHCYFVKIILMCSPWATVCRSRPSAKYIFLFIHALLDLSLCFLLLFFLCDEANWLMGRRRWTLEFLLLSYIYSRLLPRPCRYWYQFNKSQEWCSKHLILPVKTQN